MKAECIELLIYCNREIEFDYRGRKYSITYYDDNRENYISFCEANKDPIDVKNSSELLELKIGGKKLEVIFANLPDSAIDIY